MYPNPAWPDFIEHALIETDPLNPGNCVGMTANTIRLYNKQYLACNSGGYDAGNLILSSEEDSSIAFNSAYGYNSYLLLGRNGMSTVKSSCRRYGSFRIIPTASVDYTEAEAVATTNILTVAGGHGLQIGDQVMFSATTAGLTSSTTYYVLALDYTGTTFKVSETSEGAEVDITDDVTVKVKVVCHPSGTSIILSSNTAELTLPAVTGTDGLNYNVIFKGVTQFTLTAQSACLLIDGDTAKTHLVWSTTPANLALSLQSDGTNWFVTSFTTVHDSSS